MNQSINENEANIDHARFETRSVTDIINDQNLKKISLKQSFNSRYNLRYISISFVFFSLL
jgi:hypothetical protein